jgi:large subunit ribosomal protein L5
MQIPKLVKIIVNIGVGEAVQDIKNLDHAVEDLTAIAGQKPIIRRARKSISNFKLRVGVPVGCKVTLRGTMMYEFLDRLLTFAIPRIRDFRGVPGRSFDGHGNYSLGIKEQIIFPEIDFDKIDKTRGMDITFVTSTTKDEEAKALLRNFGMPFRD